MVDVPEIKFKDAINEQIKNLDLEKSVHLGIQMGKFIEYLKTYIVEVKEWINTYDAEDVINGEERHKIEQEYATKTLQDVQDYYHELFERYIYPQEVD